jgi:hypothetical protein
MKTKAIKQGGIFPASPEKFYKDISSGWKTYYWYPLKNLFKKINRPSGYFVKPGRNGAEFVI